MSDEMDRDTVDDFSSYTVDRARVLEERQQRLSELTDVIKEQSQYDGSAEITQSEVYYTLNPTALPWRHVDMGLFVRRLSEEYRIELDWQTLGLRQGADDYDELFQEIRNRLTGGQIRSLNFEDGRYLRKGAPSVDIASIRLDRESVIVNALASSDIAEAIAQDIIEFIWDCAGEPRPFSTIEPSLHLKRFATVTRVELIGRLEDLLSDKFLGFMDTKVIAPGGFAERMVPTTISSKQRFSSRDFVSSFSVDDLNLKVNVFNRVNGHMEDQAIKFTIKRNSDYGTGMISLMTHLPFAEHIQLIEALQTQIFAAKK